MRAKTEPHSKGGGGMARHKEINAIMGGEIIRGRRSIMAFYDVSWRTIQNWKAKGDLEILRYSLSGKPFILRNEAMRFLVLCDDARRKRRERGRK